jgi:hypothetical protein
MTVPSLEPVYEALFALLQGVSFAAPVGASSLTTWADASRRVKHFSEVAKELQPACYQAEHKQVWQPKRSIALPQRRIISANWIAYFRTDENQIGAQIQQLLIDGINVTLAPDSQPNDTLTLGGLVEWCRIEGDVWCEPGDLDDQGMLVVPISMMVP